VLPKWRKCLMMDSRSDTGAARELLGPWRQEQTGNWTHWCCVLARLVFLFSHGVLVMIVSASLDHISEASWWTLFIPAWIGDALCVVLLILSWFASCPYIKLCISSRQPRMGNQNPSILTELLPGIFLAVLGLFFVIFVILGEYALCKYLMSANSGMTHVWPVAVTFVILGLLAIAYGACLTHDSVLFSCVGGSLLMTTFLLAVTRNAQSSRARAVFFFPIAVGLLFIFLAVVHRLLVLKRVLTTEERILRHVEIVTLFVMLAGTVLWAVKVSAGQVATSGGTGVAVGVAMCLFALLRGRLCFVEESGRPMAVRLLFDVEEPSVNVRPAEVQIPLQTRQ